MSLVVAQTTEDGPRIVADTRVSFPDGNRPPFKKGVLKAIIVSESLSICFAGDVENGVDTIRRCVAALNTGSEVDQIIHDFKIISSKKQRSVEFIIANADPKALLIRIRNGQIENDLHSAWIGDQKAFERFQEERLKPLNDIEKKLMDQFGPGILTMSKLGDAMNAVIADPTIHSVDDFCVRISSKNRKFNYLGGTFVYIERDIHVKNGDNLLMKMTQPVEEGGYTVSIVEPKIPGTPALALNFPRAKLGLIFLPLIYDEAQVITNVLARDFANNIFETYGIKMQDPIAC